MGHNPRIVFKITYARPRHAWDLVSNYRSASPLLLFLKFRSHFVQWLDSFLVTDHEFGKRKCAVTFNSKAQRRIDWTAPRYFLANLHCLRITFIIYIMKINFLWLKIKYIWPNIEIKYTQKLFGTLSKASLLFVKTVLRYIFFNYVFRCFSPFPKFPLEIGKKCPNSEITFNKGKPAYMDSELTGREQWVAYEPSDWNCTSSTL